MKVTEVRTKEPDELEGYELEIKGQTYHILLDKDGILFNKGGFPLHALFASEYTAKVILDPHDIKVAATFDSGDGSLPKVAPTTPMPKVKPPKPKSYEVRTPIGEGPGILFDNNKQLLYYRKSHGSWSVISHPTAFNRESQKYRWVPVAREELKPGDVAYRTNEPPDYERFDRLNNCCIILADTNWYIGIDSSINLSYPHVIADSVPDLMTSGMIFKYWFKLTPTHKL